ncbi:hypothetical protein SDC9_183099 [bioreactor metagenome]|uniref:Uncharacterized protein n=1 Tax=bioreactor metagenome TaxID=1076179 RepID=A0A645H9B4_9ZZZZ
MQDGRTVTKEDLMLDAFVALDCAINLLNTIEDERFESVDAPEDWSDPSTYICVSSKIHALSSILGNAVKMLSVAGFNEDGGDYFSARIKLMANIIQQHEGRMQAHI